MTGATLINWHSYRLTLYPKNVYDYSYKFPDGTKNNTMEISNGGIMQKRIVIFSFILLLLIVSTACAANSTSTSAQDAAALVYISNVTMDPPVFFPYEQGTIYVTLTNSGTTSVGLENADILDNKVNMVNKNSWNAVSYIGAGSTLTYSFQVTIDPPDGTYFPLFSVNTVGAGSINYPFVLKVDSTDINAYISQKPDTFSPSIARTVNLTIVNPRAGSIRNIQIIPSGDGIVSSPTQKYITSLDGRSFIDVPFSITASQASTNVTFLVNYLNGEVAHSVKVILPITFGNDKTAAVPVVNNVVLTSKGSYYEITGDVTNTGITDAKGLLVTVGSPATGTGKYPQYAIGSLAADDSGSFDLTFTCRDLSSVPLVMKWKDANGNDLSTTKVLDLSSASGTDNTGSSTGTNTNRSSTATTGRPSGAYGPSGGTNSLFGGSSRGGGISSFYPVIAGAVILVVAIVLWKKRKWLSLKLKKQ